MPKWIDDPVTWAEGDPVVVRPVAAWKRRLTAGEPQAHRATVVMATPQFGDCYLVRYADGAQDVVHVSRIAGET